MLLRVDTPALAEALLSSLEQRANLVVHRIGACELAVGVLGSHADGGRSELERLLRGSQRAPGERVEVLPLTAETVRGDAPTAD